MEKIPWRRKWQLTPVILPGKSHGQKSLVHYIPRVTKSDMTERPSTHYTNWWVCVKAHKLYIKLTWSSQWHFEVGIIIIQMGKSRLTFFTCKALPHENSGAATGRDVGWICLVWRALWSTHYLNLNPFLNFSFVQLNLRPVPLLLQRHSLLSIQLSKQQEVCSCFKTVFLWSHCYDAALLNGTDYCRETHKNLEMEAK